MPHRLETHLPRLTEAVRNGRIIIVTDLDGALVTRKPAFHNPVPPDFDLENSFLRLQATGNQVAINTGRPDIFVRNLFPVAQNDMWVATETGALIIPPRSLTPVFKRAVEGHERLMSIFRNEVQKIDENIIVEEYKTCAITINMAALPPEHILGAYNHFQHIARQQAGDIATVIAVHKPNIDTYIEIVPHGVDKGSATDYILQRIKSPNDVVICFGDTVADQPMMAAVNDAGGVSFGVGAKAPDNATVRLDTVDEARALVAKLAAEAAAQLRIA